MSESEAVERNVRMHTEALRRAHARNAGPEPAVEPVDYDGRAIAAAQRVEREAVDASLNWNSGQPTAHSAGPRDVPFSSDLAQVSGVGAERADTHHNPPDFAHRLTSAPRVASGCSGIAEIVGHTSGGKR